MDTSTDRAVVLGGGIAGLLAAAACADHHDEVVIVERDELAPVVSPRRGVPQGRHAHALLAAGQQVLEHRFPGLSSSLVAAGAPVGDVGRDTRMYVSGHQLKPVTTGLVAISATRPFLEHHIRERVLERAGVRVLSCCDAVGLSLCPQQRRIDAVHLLRRADSSAAETLPARTVVDATGRTSRTAAWLDELRLGRPRDERVLLDLAYASRRYQLAPEALGGDLAIIQAPTPVHPRGAVLARVEHEQALLTVIGLLGDRMPIDPLGFDDFVASLHRPDVPEALQTARPLDEPVRYRFPAAVRKHYEKLRQLPDGFAIVGDAVCSLNPIYGQGITVAAWQADVLADHLRQCEEVRQPELQRNIAATVAPTWKMASGGDLAFPGADGHRTIGTRLLGAYVTQLHAAARDDEVLAQRCYRVAGLVDKPVSLLRPSVVARVATSRRTQPSEVTGPLRASPRAG